MRVEHRHVKKAVAPIKTMVAMCVMCGDDYVKPEKLTRETCYERACMNAQRTLSLRRALKTKARACETTAGAALPGGGFKIRASWRTSESTGAK
jgi:hypothetical protein